MGNIWTIARKEFVSYFTSPVAYVAITVLFVVVGLKFFVVDDFFVTRRADLRSFFELLPYFFVFYLPAIAMRLVAEEKRQGTFELLATLPVADRDVILGKYLGAVGFLVVTLLATLPYPLLVSFLGDPDPGTIYGGYLGLLFVGLVFLAFSVMASTWTGSQIVAYIIGSMLSALFFLLDLLMGIFGEATRKIAEYASVQAHFASFSKGVIDTRDIVFFVSLVALALTLATFSLNRRRWN